MNLYIHTHPFSLSTALRDFVEKKLKKTAAKHISLIHRVDVRITDLNGPKGGPDKRCQISFSLPGRKTLTLEHTHSNAYAALTAVVKRASRQLTQKYKPKPSHHTPSLPA